jgi:hypothetical protein
MKRVALYSLLFLVLVGAQCERESEEDLYYEPLVDGIYTVSTDLSQALSFTIEPNKALSVSGQFSNGINFTVEFEADALKFNESVEASINPISQILDMDSDFQFHFGFAFSPEGVQFNNPGKMTVELPAGIDINNFKGFFFQGGVPYSGQEAEIWSVKLTPLLFQSANGKKLAVFELPHFSGFIGVSGGDFKCGNPLAADVCDDLKEILACYIAGKESLTSEDMKKVNGALRDWLDSGLQWLENNPSEMDEDWEIENALGEILCWKASALMFNATLAPFDALLDKVGKLFTRTLVDKLVQLNNECIAIEDAYEQAASFGMNSYYLSLLESLRSAGMLSEDPGISYVDYCGGIASKFYIEAFMDTTVSYIRSPSPNTYELDFGPVVSPAVARSLGITVYAVNLLGEPSPMKLGEDYTIQKNSNDWFSINGNLVTEVLTTCYKTVNEVSVPYPCYPSNNSLWLNIVMNDSQEAITVLAGRYGW